MTTLGFDMPYSPHMDGCTLCQQALGWPDRMTVLGDCVLVI